MRQYCAFVLVSSSQSSDESQHLSDCERSQFVVEGGCVVAVRLVRIRVETLNVNNMTTSFHGYSH